MPRTPEEWKIYRHTYYLAHKEKFLLSNKKRLRNPEIIQKVNEWRKKWREKNKVKIQEQRRRYAKHRLTKARNIKISFGLICKRCGLKNENPSFFDLDHIIPAKTTEATRRKSRKGGNIYSLKELGNYQVLCPNCHRLKTIENKDFLPISRQE